MKRRLRALTHAAAFGRALTAALSAGSASAQTNQPIASQADKEKAYQALKTQASSQAGNPAFDYQLGIAALDAGQYGEAIIALQRLCRRLGRL
ncbi:MAG: hypothetical protein AAF249_13105 [Pseudomonadota bacterium]